MQRLGSFGAEDRAHRWHRERQVDGGGAPVRAGRRRGGCRPAGPRGRGAGHAGAR